MSACARGRLEIKGWDPTFFFLTFCFCIVFQIFYYSFVSPKLLPFHAGTRKISGFGIGCTVPLEADQSGSSKRVYEMNWKNSGLETD